MNKFLKKNYKKILIVCLIIMLLLSNKIEKFTTTQALDGVKAIEKKVNDMYYSVDTNWNKSNKGIYGKKSIEAEGNIVSRQGDILAKKMIKADHNIESKRYIHGKRVYIGEKLCIGSTCLYEDQLKMLRNGFTLQSLNYIDKAMNGKKGHHSGHYVHTHTDGSMKAHGTTKYRNIFKMHKTT